MKLKEFLKVLEKIAPLDLTEDYDAKNGIQIEGTNVEVKKVLTCLDVTPSIVEKAAKESCQMIISHHHPIISPTRTILQRDWYGEIITNTLKHNITIYTIHTAYDAVKGGLNDYVGKLIGLHDMYPLQRHNVATPHGMGRIGLLQNSLTLDEFAHVVYRNLNASTIKIVGQGNKIVHKVALGTGNGLALIPEALKSNVDVYVTGDVQYHDMREALQHNMALIAVEHDDTEKFFSLAVKEAIEKFASNIEVIAYNDRFYHTLKD